MLFISPSKLFSFSRYLSFCLDFLFMYKSSLIRKIRLISKFMTSQPILSNISRSKGNQAMNFGQLIKYNMRNIFVEKSYTKCVEETTSKPFSKKSKLSLSLHQQSDVNFSINIPVGNNIFHIEMQPVNFACYIPILEQYFSLKCQPISCRWFSAIPSPLS